MIGGNAVGLQSLTINCNFDIQGWKKILTLTSPGFDLYRSKQTRQYCIHFIYEYKQPVFIVFMLIH